MNGIVGLMRGGSRGSKDTDSRCQHTRSTAVTPRTMEGVYPSKRVPNNAGAAIVALGSSNSKSWKGKAAWVDVNRTECGCRTGHQGTGKKSKGKKDNGSKSKC